MVATEELVQSLNTELEDARKHYYAGSPVLSDAEYDAKELELKGLLQGSHLETDTVLDHVGTDVSGRVPHPFPMRSMENVYNEEELKAFYDKFPYATVSLSSKYDGVSVDLRYESGGLVQALSRGDGESGEDVTLQAKTCLSIPKSMLDGAFSTGTVVVQGEMMILTSTMERLNQEIIAKGGKPYVSTRNLVAGTMKLQDIEEVRRREIVFQPWAVLTKGTADVIPDSMQKRLRMIAQKGFRLSDETLAHSWEDLTTQLNARLKSLESEQEIGKDGVVIKLDSLLARERAGVGSKNANWAVAYKPQNMTAVTRVRGVEWATSRGGRLVPVAVLDPVVLGGATIERVTLNNLTWLRAMGVMINSKVDIVRSGDVIPKIVSAIPSSPVDPGTIGVYTPKICPDCEGPIISFTEPASKVETHWCENVQCPGRVADMLVYVADRTVLEIDGLGPDLAAKFTQSEIVTDLADLFEWEQEFRLENEKFGSRLEKGLAESGFSYVTLVKVSESLQRAKTASWDRWLAALCIPMFGRRLGKLLASSLRLDPEDFNILPGKLATVRAMNLEGLGPLKLAELDRNLKDPQFTSICRRLYEAGVRPTPTYSTAESSSELSDIVFCITGDFLQFGEREEITKKLESLGAVSKTGVSKKVNLLLVGNSAGKTKTTKAEALGIKMVGAEWLQEVYEKYRLGITGIDMEAEYVD